MSSRSFVDFGAMEWGFKLDRIQPTWQDFFGVELEPAAGIVLPKRSFSVADLQRIRAYITGGVPRRTRYHPPYTPPDGANIMANGLVGSGPMGEVGPREIRVATISERLEAEESNLVARLDKVRALRLGLKDRPEVASIIDGLSSLGHLNY
jgi:hypothetical protein